MNNSIWKDIPAQLIKSGAVYVGPGLVQRAIADATQMRKIAEESARKALKVAFSPELENDINMMHGVYTVPEKETDMDLKSIIRELEELEEPKAKIERINDERRHIEWNKKSVPSTVNNIVGKQSFDDSFPNGAIRNLET